MCPAENTGEKITLFLDAFLGDVDIQPYQRSLLEQILLTSEQGRELRFRVVPMRGKCYADKRWAAIWNELRTRLEMEGAMDELRMR